MAVAYQDRNTDREDQRSLRGLLSGIVGDAQTLLHQHGELLRSEVKEDMRQSKETAMAFGTSLAVAFVGFLFLSLMVVHLLSWLMEGLPLWGSFGIVGVLLAGASYALFEWAKKSLKDAEPLYPEKSVDQAKEDVECLVHPH